MKTLYKLLFMASTAVSCAVSSSALAQAAATPDDGQTIGEIIVTARRMQERMQDVPISMTVYNQEQLNARNIVYPADLGKFTPSLSTNQRYGPDKASFAIRGFVQDLNTAPSVGVYFADVVAPRASVPTGGGDVVGPGALFDLANVQVLKGPQGTLFGRNTTGGAVLLVPQRPTDQYEGYVEVSRGNYQMRRLQAVVNLPLAERLKVRLGVDGMKRDGYEPNRWPLGPSAFADVDYIAARLSILAELTPTLENYTIASYSNSYPHGVLGRVTTCITPQQLAASPPAAQAQLGVGFFFGCAQLARQTARGDGPRDVESSNPDSAERVRQWQAINTTTWQATANLTVKNIFSYAEFREADRFSVGGDNFLNPLDPNATQPALTLIYVRNGAFDNAAQSTLTDELRFQGQALDNRLTWQGGGYLEISNPLGYSSQFVQTFLNCTNALAFQCAGAGSLSLPFIKTEYRNKGLYAQATYKLTDQLSLTGGYRYTWDTSTQFYASSAAVFPAPNTPFFICSNAARIRNPDGSTPVVIPSLADFQRCGVSFTADSSAPTWLLDLDYKPTDDVLTYVKWARGYRAGGAVSSNPFFETWQPEHVDTYEIGAKTSFRGPIPGYFNIAGFFNDFRNQQLQATLVTANPALFVGGSGVVNAGKSQIWGIEVDASIAPIEHVRLDVGYTYLNTKLLEITPPSVPAAAACCIASVTPTAVVGGPLALSPRNRVTTSATYTLPVEESIGHISVSTNFTHTDSQIASQTSINGFGVLPPQNLLNFSVDWNAVLGSKVDLSAFVTNALNAYFPLNITNLGAAFGFESVIPNEPRMFGFRARARFGG